MTNNRPSSFPQSDISNQVTQDWSLTLPRSTAFPPRRSGTRRLLIPPSGVPGLALPPVATPVSKQSLGLPSRSTYRCPQLRFRSALFSLPPTGPRSDAPPSCTTTCFVHHRFSHHALRPGTLRASLETRLNVHQGEGSQRFPLEAKGSRTERRGTRWETGPPGTGRRGPARRGYAASSRLLSCRHPQAPFPLINPGCRHPQA